MTEDRSKRYAVIAAVAAVVVCCLLCFLLVLSPKLRKLRRLNQELATSSKQLADMRREIEDARIAGPAAEGESRFEKFGILGFDEEQLFLSDLIDFCAQTTNTLELVRRSDVPRRVSTEPQQQQPTPERQPAPKPPPSAAATETAPVPVIERVLHTVSYSGTFLSSFYLLQKLESYKRLLTVERMEVATDNRLGYPRVNGNIVIDLYLVREATAAAAQSPTPSQPARPAPGGVQPGQTQEP